MTGARWLGRTTAVLGLAVGLSASLGGCAGTVPGTAAPVATTTSSPAATSTPSTSSPSPSSSSSSSSSAQPTVADTDYDSSAMCLFLNLGFLDVNGQYLDWQAATVAGTTPPVPTEQVAAAIDAAVTENEGYVAEVDPGPVQEAGLAVLGEARALTAAMRAGGGTDPSSFTAAFDGLDAVCPD